MRIVIEFYRIRPQDGAHAVVGREMADAVDLDDAIRRAWALAETLDMPQRPDAFAVRGMDGVTLHSCALGAAATPEAPRDGS
ncbi:hypothetical protein [Nitrospirillum iridis]|uniref:Uncharacterized protein n=1 Tax=Nitrospirillum iridis TaxID=765888 RepID=A0A7X0AVC3_9PROT|nr:hypothetical protein [Nitrospirillum iridis]MBB6250773.1 hypothetical protein [Nitrospirillum iridis]